MSEHIRSIQELDLSVNRPLYPSPADWRDQFIYFFLVDRFNDGKERKPFDGVRGAMPSNPQPGTAFQGGTLAGVTEKLDYIRALGATTIWVSPVFKNRPEPSGTFHGYAIQNFLEIDPRIGTTEDLITLVQEAHQRGMYVVLDIIINHTGDNWAYKDDVHPTYSHDGTRYDFGYWRSESNDDTFGPDDAVWPAELQSPACYKRRGAIRDWNNTDEAIHGDFFNLKELDMSNSIVLETLQAVYKYWIRVADIDGYRIDTVKHVEHEATASFCTAIKEYASAVGKKNFFLFGEKVADDTVLRRYVGTRTEGAEKRTLLDAALDFPLYFVLEEVIKGFADPQVLRERYERLHRLYPESDSSDFFVTFVDNHDQMVRPARRFLHNAPQEQALLAVGYLLTSPGVPALYYGTEQGFDGGAPEGVPPSDMYVRECMFGGGWGAFGTTEQHFFDTEHPLFLGIATLADARRNEPALRYGRFYFRDVSDSGDTFAYPAKGWGLMAYARILDTTELLMVLNVQDRPLTQYVSVDRSLTPAGTLLTDLLEPEVSVLVEERGGHAAAKVNVPGYGVRIFKANPEHSV
jgi:glycosidase